MRRQQLEEDGHPEKTWGLTGYQKNRRIPHNIYFLWRPYLRDRKDELVLELAVAARCSAIITYNQRDFHGADLFGIRVLDPRAFLQIIGELP